MRVETSGTASFRVDATGAVFSVSAEDLDWDCNGSEERGMGPELVYTAEVDVAGFSVTWSLWEYPVGVQNYEDIHVPKGLTLISDLDYQLVHEPD